MLMAIGGGTRKLLRYYETMIYRTVAPTILGTLHATSTPSTLTNKLFCSEPPSALAHATVKSGKVVNPGCTVSKIFFFGGRTLSGFTSSKEET